MYDLEKALKHAEITWAQDPFRKKSSIPGKPSFDIDFSKNPAEHKNQKPIEIVNIQYEIRDPRKPLIVKGASTYIEKIYDSEENYRSNNKPVENKSSVLNPRNTFSRTKPKHDIKRYDPPLEKLVKESHIDESSTITQEDSEFSIEDLTWTPALLRRKVDQRKPKQAAY